MKPEELRIGNYVTINNEKSYSGLKGIPFKVVGIHKLEKYSIQLSNNEYYEYNQFIEFIQPIKLNEELLLKCGLKKVLGGIGWDKFIKDGVELSFAPLVGGGYIPVYRFNNDYIKIRFLHQLQNLFYALTQKELEIKL